MKRLVLLVLLLIGCGGEEAPSGRPVVMFGTSLTSGDSGTGIAWMLEPHRPEFGIRVINRGYGGHSSRMLLDHLEEARGFRGELVFIEAVMNDAMDPEIRPDLVVELEDTRLYLREMVLAFMSDGSRVYLMTTNPDTNDVNRHPDLESYYEVVREVAAETGCGLIDLYGEWLRYSDGELREMIPDGTHPTNESLEEVVYPVLRGYLN